MVEDVPALGESGSASEEGGVIQNRRKAPSGVDHLQAGMGRG